MLMYGCFFPWVKNRVCIEKNERIQGDTQTKPKIKCESSPNYIEKQKTPIQKNDSNIITTKESGDQSPQGSIKPRDLRNILT